MEEIDMLHMVTIVGPFTEEGCGGVAYQYDHRPWKGEKSDAKHVVNPSPAYNGHSIPCLTCGTPVGPRGTEPEGGWADTPAT